VIVALLVLVPIAGVVVWTFFRLSPSGAQSRTVLRFNVGALVVALALAAGWSVRTYLVMTPTVDAAWWPVISVLGMLIIIPLVLGLAAVVRSFVLCRRSIGPSQH
jgi:hypothetical protein